MIVNGFQIQADPEKTLRRKSDKEYVGVMYSLGYIYYLNGQKLEEGYLEKEEDFEELTWSEVGDDLGYGRLVDQFIRERYSLSDELAIQRQRDTKPEVFEKYFMYCEECKKRALHESGLDEIEFA